MNGNYVISLAGYAEGIYFYKVNSNGATVGEGKIILK